MILHFILSPVEIKIIEIKLKFLIVGIRRVPRWWQLKLNIAKILVKDDFNCSVPSSRIYPPQMA